jgi:hypothetical protein
MEPEAGPLRGALARVKAARFGRLIVTVDALRTVVVIEKVNREMLRAVSM